MHPVAWINAAVSPRESEKVTQKSYPAQQALMLISLVPLEAFDF